MYFQLCKNRNFIFKKLNSNKNINTYLYIYPKCKLNEDPKKHTVFMKFRC